jgi:hypothetical protein
MISSSFKYLKKNFDDLAIAGLLGRLAVHASNTGFEDDELSVLAALRRANPQFETLTPDEISAHLGAMDEHQIVGLVSLVKGVLHELEFMQIENADGDSVTASIFSDANHPDYDVLLFDGETDQWSQVQLKASDSTSYVQDWINTHEDGEIVVTEELAEKMDLASSGSSNEELTVRTEDFLDKLQEMEDSDSLSVSLALLTPLSICIASWELIQRWRAGQISDLVFRTQLALISGKKVIKLGSIALLMSIPVINVVTAVLLLSKLLFGLQGLTASTRKDYIDI